MAGRWYGVTEGQIEVSGRRGGEAVVSRWCKLHCSCQGRQNKVG